MAGAAEELTVPTKANGIYCIKCRDHTEDLEPHKGQITSKGQPRSVMKATCAVCSKRKNRFNKTVKVNTEQVGLIENKARKQQEIKVLKKLIENLLQKFIKSQSIISDENES